MRELKFRAWHKKRRKFYEVLHLHLSVMKSDGIWATCKGRDCITVQDIPIKIAPKDICIMQYIDRRDKNKVELCEGDVLISDEAGWTGYIVYRNACYMLIDNDGDFCGEPEWDKCLKIGNKFENPGLLEGARDE